MVDRYVRSYYHVALTVNIVTYNFSTSIIGNEVVARFVTLNPKSQK